tara:strand:- start:1000 stop:3327 length:2328 start_codon:yes stop_codon:yes gene_type:complete
MNVNEHKMKLKGESRVWASITKSNGKAKDASSTQIGQRILFDDALFIVDPFMLWVEKSSKIDRKSFKELFVDYDTSLFIITSTLLFLSGSTSGALEYNSNDKIKTRHKRIKSLNEKIFTGLKFEQVWRIVEVIVDYSKIFEIEKSALVVNNFFKTSVSYVCNLDETIHNELTISSMKAFYPMLITEPPLDWELKDGNISGGYHTYQHKMIRVKPQYLNYNKYSKGIFDSVNYIQSQSWRINEVVLKAVDDDIRMPIKSDYVKVIYPSDDGCNFEIKINDENNPLSDSETTNIKSSRDKFQQSLNLYLAEVRDFESAIGKYRAVKMAIEIAKEYVGEDVYFPHSYDSRGRIYPIPVGLSPQGSDAVKAMLEYSNGQVLNSDGAAWAFAYLASLYGDDKLHFDDRVKRGMQLINEDYKDADEPYQFLAHQIECKKIAEDPRYVFKGRIHLDACNSGSQFTSALTGDLDGCLATNVVPTIGKDGLCDRQDAYLLVSNKSIELTKSILCGDLTHSDRRVYEMLLELLEKHGRKICKRPVMVSNYGGTAGGRAKILFDMFRELNLDREYITSINSIKLAKIIGDSITGVLNGGKAFEKYIQTMNNVISKKGVPIKWLTGDGFLVIHVKNKELPPKKCSLKLPNARKQTTIIKKIYSDEVAPSKMRSAISPNYIHSLDAELLRRVALRMRDEGIKNSDWIHDSFGCLPNDVDMMLKISKEVFLEMMVSEPLSILDKGLRQQAVEAGVTSRQLSKIELPKLYGFDIKNGGIDSIIDSEWFFS